MFWRAAPSKEDKALYQQMVSSAIANGETGNDLARIERDLYNKLMKPKFSLSVAFATVSMIAVAGIGAYNYFDLDFSKIADGFSENFEDGFLSGMYNTAAEGLNLASEGVSYVVNGVSENFENGAISGITETLKDGFDIAGQGMAPLINTGTEVLDTILPTDIAKIMSSGIALLGAGWAGSAVTNGAGPLKRLMAIGAFMTVAAHGIAHSEDNIHGDHFWFGAIDEVSETHEPVSRGVRALGDATVEAGQIIANKLNMG